MKEIIFHPEARAEFVEATRYYKTIQISLGDRFKEAVRMAVEQIAERPERYRILKEDIRTCRVLRFPYTVLYTIKPDGIKILAVAHFKRKPGYWKKRQ